MPTGKLTAKNKFFILMSFLTYVVMALPITVQGSLAPVTMEFFGINAAQQGLIVTMQAIGSLCTGLFLGLHGERYNKIYVIALGMFIMCVMGAAVGTAPSYGVFLLMVVAMGIGVTFVDIMQNGVVSDVYPMKKNTLLPLIHGFFALGAMLTPSLITQITGPDQPDTFSNPFRALFVLALGVGFLYLISGRSIMHKTPYINMDKMKRRVAENPAEIFKAKKAWFFIAVGIFYFTYQFGTIMWLPTFMIENAGVDYHTGGLALTVFFAGNLVMRFVGPLFFRVLAPRIIYAVFGAIAAALMLCALFTENVTVIFILLAAVGFMQGSSVAAFMLICIEAFPGRTASASSITTLSNGIATLTAPLWMGALSAYTGFLIPMIMISGCLIVGAALIFFKGK